MADNTALPTSDAGGDTIRTEDRTTFKTPVSLIDVGGTTAEKLLGDSGGFLPLANTVKDGTGTFYAPLVDADGHLQADVLSVTGTVTVDGSGVTQPVSAASLPLPTGAATSANQSTANTALAAIQTAVEILDNAISGTEMQVDIVSSAAIPVTDNSSSLTVDAANDGSLVVQIGDGTSLATVRNLAANDALNVAIVDGSGNQVTSFGGSGGTSATDDSAFTAGSGSGTPVMGFFSADTVDAGDTGVLAMDASRRLLVSIEADNVGIGGGTQYTEDAAAPANPVGNAMMAERDDALGGLTPVEGDWSHLFCDANGALWVNVNTSALPSGAATSANQTTIIGHLDGVEGLLTTIDADTGTLAGAVSGSEMQVDVVAALPAGTNLVGDVGIQGRTTGGLSTYWDNDLDETAVAVKAGAGTLYAIHAINLTAAPLYLQLFDVAQGSVTVGTTSPTMQFVIPANADSDGAGFTLNVPQGIAFGTAITAAASTDNGGNGAPTANACHVNLFYK